MIRIKFQDLYCHFIVILNQMVMLFLLKIGELSMIMTQMEKWKKIHFSACEFNKQVQIYNK